MSEKILGLIELMNTSEIEAFKMLTPKQKSTTIIKDFEKYYSFQSKASKAKNNEEKERYYFEVERHFVKVNKEIKMLDEDELSVYIDAVNNRVLNAIDSHKESTYTDNQLLFGTLLRQMPENIDENNAQAIENLKHNIEDYESIMSMQSSEKSM